MREPSLGSCLIIATTKTASQPGQNKKPPPVALGGVPIRERIALRRDGNYLGTIILARVEPTLRSEFMGSPHSFFPPGGTLVPARRRALHLRVPPRIAQCLWNDLSAIISTVIRLASRCAAAPERFLDLPLIFHRFRFGRGWRRIKLLTNLHSLIQRNTTVPFRGLRRWSSTRPRPRASPTVLDDCLDCSQERCSQILRFLQRLSRAISGSGSLVGCCKRTSRSLATPTTPATRLQPVRSKLIVA